MCAENIAVEYCKNVDQKVLRYVHMQYVLRNESSAVPKSTAISVVVGLHCNINNPGIFMPTPYFTSF